MGTRMHAPYTMTPSPCSSTGCTWCEEVPHTTLAPASIIARPKRRRRAASQPHGFVGPAAAMSQSQQLVSETNYRNLNMTSLQVATGRTRREQNKIKSQALLRSHAISRP